MLNNLSYPDSSFQKLLQELEKKEVYELSNKLRTEWVIEIKGIVKARPKSIKIIFPWSLRESTQP